MIGQGKREHSGVIRFIVCKLTCKSKKKKKNCNQILNSEAARSNTTSLTKEVFCVCASVSLYGIR